MRRWPTRVARAFVRARSINSDISPRTRGNTNGCDRADKAAFIGHNLAMRSDQIRSDFSIGAETLFCNLRCIAVGLFQNGGVPCA
jgi:hypothetical protein